MASFSNHNTPRAPDEVDSNTNATVGETLWSQIMVHLPLQERDEVKRILGTEVIDDNESVWTELSALKSILDDYRQQLFQRENTNIKMPAQTQQQHQEQAFEKQQHQDERTTQRNKEIQKHKVVDKRKTNRESGSRQSTAIHSRSILPAGPQQLFLESQIRMFVTNLSTLNTTTVEALSTPRERSLVDAIVNNDKKKKKKNTTTTKKKKKNASGGGHGVVPGGRRRRTESSPEKRTMNAKGPLRKSPDEKKNGTPDRRPGTAPDARSSEKRRRSRPSPSKHRSKKDMDNETGATATASTTNDFFVRQFHLLTSSRPSSRESEMSTSSAPDVLIGLTPYLNVHQVETVLYQLRIALQEEGVRLRSDVSSVNQALERLYSNSNRKKRFDEKSTSNRSTRSNRNRKRTISREEEEEEDIDSVVGGGVEEDVLAPPSIEELRDLSERLEQRCRLEDIFQNKSSNKKMVKPMKIRLPIPRPSLSNQMNSSLVPSSVGLLRSSGRGNDKGGKGGSGSGMVEEEKMEMERTRRMKKKSSSMRARIQEAQDSQYLT
jgi:hypothetical protein